MKRTFELEDLKGALETALKSRLIGLETLKSVNALNFKATREDGFVFVVKCMPKVFDISYRRIVLHLAQMKGAPFAPQRLFEGVVPDEFKGMYLLCLSWCEGRGLPPDALSSADYRRFMEDYLRFVEALAGTTDLVPVYPTRLWRDQALAKCRGASGSRLRALVEIAEDELTEYRVDKVRPIHGDMHPGNLAFKDGRVTGFLDVESFTEGYPAWDFVRYFVFALEHVEWYKPWRRRTIYRRFGESLAFLPYDLEDWLISINASWLERVEKKFSKDRVGYREMLALSRAAHVYRNLKLMAVTAKFG